jgi:hypothetical protein
VARCAPYSSHKRGERSESVPPLSNRPATTQLTLARFESFRNDLLGSSHSENASTLVTSTSVASTTSKVKSLGTLRFGRYYVKLERHPTGKLPTNSNVDLRSIKEHHFGLSELSNRSYRSELSSEEGLLSELPVFSDEELRQELPTDRSGSSASPQELLDPDSMTSAIFESDAVYELESDLPMPFGSQYSYMDPVGYAHSGKGDTPAFHGRMHPAFAPVPTPASLPRLQTEEHLNGLPSLVSANSSHTPSPVSPVTPSLQTARSGSEAEQQADVSPITATGPPYQPAPPLLQQSDIEEYVPQYSYDRFHDAELESSFASTQDETFSYSRPMSGNLNHDTHHVPYFSANLRQPAHGVASYQRINQELVALETRALWNGTDFLPMGNERTEYASSWHRNLPPSANTSGISTIHRHPGFFNPPLLLDDINRSDECFPTHDTTTQLNEDAEVGTQELANLANGRHTPRYPTESCRACGKEFTGRYAVA